MDRQKTDRTIGRQTDRNTLLYIHIPCIVTQITRGEGNGEENGEKYSSKYSEEGEGKGLRF